MERINLYERYVPNICVTDIDVEFIDERYPEDGLFLIPVFEFFDDEENLITHFYSSANSCGIPMLFDVFRDNIYDIYDELVKYIYSNGIMDIIEIDFSQFENKLIVANKKITIDYANELIYKIKKDYQLEIYLLLLRFQRYLNMYLTKNSIKSSIEFTNSHLNIKPSNKIFNSPYGSIYYINDLNTDVYKKINFNGDTKNFI